jgi:hypothetical protein
MAQDVNGVFVVMLQLEDNGTGPEVPPNNNKSQFQSFTISVNAVNDAPQFQLSTQTVDADEDENDGEFDIPGFAMDLSAGPSDEDGQALAFDVTVLETDGSLAFTTLPTITRNGGVGDLSFTTAPDTNGSATIVVTLRDDGNGTAPHANTSTPQTFTVNVASVNDRPFVANAVADFTVEEDAPSTDIELFPNVFNDVDVNAFDNDSLTLTVVNEAVLSAQGLVGTSIVQTSQSVILTLDYLPNQNGVAEVIVQAEDTFGETVETTFTVTVTAVNDRRLTNVVGG